MFQTNSQRNFLHYTFAHRRSLIKSIPFSQALRLKKIFTETSEFSNFRVIITYRRNKNLGDLIGSRKILDDNVIRKNNRKKQLYCRTYLTRRDNICCQEVLKTNTFASYRTRETFKIFHQLNCKSPRFIYLLQFQICQL